MQGRSLGPGVHVQLMAAETLGTHLAFGHLLARIQRRLLAQGTRQKSRWTCMKELPSWQLCSLPMEDTYGTISAPLGLWAPPRVTQ